MRIIITGGTGLIGRSLAAVLTNENHEVILLSRSPNRTSGIPAGARVERWDAITSAGWGHLADGADAIINLAGAGIADARWTDKRKELIKESRMLAGRAVVEAVENAEVKPKVLIQASAVGYYGGTLSDKILTEDSSPGDDYLADVCFDWERSTSAVEAMGVRRAIIRTGIVLSNAGGAWPKIKLPFMLFAGGPLGSGEQWYPWIHITDEVRAIIHLIENQNASGAFNLAAPVPVKNKEMAKVVGKVMGRPSFIPAPGFALKAALGEMSTILLDGQRAIPQNLTETGFRFTYPEIEGAVSDLVGRPAAQPTAAALNV